MPKTWFITGASRGFGGLIAEEALRRGDNVVATARDPAKFAVEGLTEALALELKPLGIRATVVEPGFFRTDFLDPRSLSVSGAEIADYAETAGAMRHFAAGANHAQPGDPAKLARAILQAVDADEPPTRMPFGSDTVRRIEAKNAFVARELAEWRELALSTDAA